jgi:hypothetical protein
LQSDDDSLGQEGLAQQITATGGFTCQFFDEALMVKPGVVGSNLAAMLTQDAQASFKVTNVYVSAYVGDFNATAAPTASPTPAPVASPTQSPTAMPSIAAPSLAPTPAYGLMGFDYGRSMALSADDFDCMADNAFDFFIQRGFITWRTEHEGLQNDVDPNLCAHLRLAYNAGLHVQGIYLEPRPRFGVSYTTVVTAVKRELVNHCPAFSNTPVFLSAMANRYQKYGWKDSYEQNKAWIEGFLTECKEYFSTCGVLSTDTVWVALFNDVSYTNSLAFDDVSLWYSVVDSTPNFKDFSDGDASFGGWSAPSMKQFVSRSSVVCDIVAGLNWRRSS